MQITECVIPFPEGLELRTPKADGSFGKAFTSIGMKKGEFLARDPFSNSNEAYHVSREGFTRIDDPQNISLPVTYVEVRRIVDGGR